MSVFLKLQMHIRKVSQIKRAFGSLMITNLRKSAKPNILEIFTNMKQHVFYQACFYFI